MNALPLVLSPEVAAAVADGRPVVALESTLVAHGFPPPRGVEVALAMEAEVRAAGAVPATIGVVGGELRVGLDRATLERLGGGARKMAPRDFAVAVARGEDGTTTVAGTLWVAARAGLRVLATGGIGGVHRGTPLDVSADLPELARTAVAVVCAGVKAILDLPATLEWLETAGVPVVGWGCDELPGFWTRTTGLALPASADDAEGVAAIAAAHWRLGGGGVLAVAPLPARDAVDTATIATAIDTALAEAGAAGIRGKAVTPFLLGRVGRLTGGVSETANVALLRQNARLGGALAVALVGGG